MAKKRAKRSKGAGCVYLPKSGGRILSHVYRARWVVDGKTYTRSTGTSDRREAEKVLAQFVYPFQAETKEEREAAMLAQLQGTRAEIEAWKDAQPALGVKAAFAAYRKSASRPNGANADTLDRYEAQFDELAKWLAVHHPDVQELRQVTSEMAEAFADELKRTRTAGTFNKRITLYRSLWDHLAESARLAVNPWKRIRKAELVTHTRRELSVDELGRVCRSTSGEMRLLFAVGIYTGLRLGDAATLDWGAVDLARGIISIIPHKTAKHAHGKPVIIPIHPTLGAMLAELPPAARRGHVMPDTAALYARDAAALSKRIQATFEAVGIRTQGEKSISGRATIDIGFHSLRHSFVSLSANAGTPLALVQSIVGHSNPSMTRHYFHERLDALQGAVAALPDVTAQTTPEAATDSHGELIAAIRANVSRATIEELNEALEIIRNSITDKEKKP